MGSVLAHSTAKGGRLMAGGHRTGHVHALYRHGTSPIHSAPPHLKIAAAVSFVFAVVATPREAVWAFAVYAGVLVALAVIARLPARFVAARMVIEVPFVIVALLLPFFAGGEQTEFLGVSLSTSGLWSAWNIIAKATLGLLTSVVLAGTTQVPELLRGLSTLRVPAVLISIMGFMVRYLDVVMGELRRMHVAMHARGYHPRWLGHVRPYAASVGSLFVRSYERGERVYLAMASRGYRGVMPSVPADRSSVVQRLSVASTVALAWTVAVLGWVLR